MDFELELLNKRITLLFNEISNTTNFWLDLKELRDAYKAESKVSNQEMLLEMMLDKIEQAVSEEDKWFELYKIIELKALCLSVK